LAPDCRPGPPGCAAATEPPPVASRPVSSGSVLAGEQLKLTEPAPGSYALPRTALLRPGTPHKARTTANDIVIAALQDVFEQFPAVAPPFGGASCGIAASFPLASVNWRILRLQWVLRLSQMRTTGAFRARCAAVTRAA